jgi:hypothetical protein
MARDRSAREGIYVEKPRNDVYVVLLIFSCIAMGAACLIMKLAATS